MLLVRAGRGRVLGRAAQLDELRARAAAAARLLDEDDAQLPEQQLDRPRVQLRVVAAAGRRLVLRDSSVGSCGISCCTTFEKASKTE